jgi:hypothetical protein
MRSIFTVRYKRENQDPRMNVIKYHVFHARKKKEVIASSCQRHCRHQRRRVPERRIVFSQGRHLPIVGHLMVVACYTYIATTKWMNVYNKRK